MCISDISATVITLTYKNYSHLFDTIRSVLSQNCEEFEYIISDDGSGDFPESDVRQFVEKNKKENLKRFELLINPQNVGTVKHLNSVIEKCRGEYIFELSSNDCFINDSVVNTILHAFDVECCDALIISRAQIHNGVIKSIIPHYKDWDKVRLLDTPYKRYEAMMRTEHYDMFIAPNVIYKREACLKNNNFDEKYVLLEDAPMIAKLLWNNNVSIRPDLFAVAYDDLTGVSSRKSTNIILKNDIKKYNLEGKLDHYDDLDKKTKRHIDFGIRRGMAKNKVEFVLICFIYFPRIVEYLFYCLGRLLSARGDASIVKELSYEMNGNSYYE